MKFFSSLATVGLMTTGALAQGYYGGSPPPPTNATDIANALTKIQAQALVVQQNVVTWDGSKRGLKPIESSGNKLLKLINRGTRIADRSVPLTFDDIVNVLSGPTFALQDTTNQTLVAFIAAKPKFAKVCQIDEVRRNFKKQKSASARFGSAVQAKAPTDLQELVGIVNAQLAAFFDTAIAEFVDASIEPRKCRKKKHYGGYKPYGKREAEADAEAEFFELEDFEDEA